MKKAGSVAEIGSGFFTHQIVLSKQQQDFKVAYYPILLKKYDAFEKNKDSWLSSAIDC